MAAEPNTVDRLRADIDAGRARDKIPGFDPAAAPLGTDEEAAGTPVTPRAIATARRNEVDAAPRTKEDGGVLAYVLAISLVALVLVGAVIVLIRQD